MVTLRLLAARWTLCLLPLGCSGAIAAQQQTLDCILEPEMTIELSSAVDGVVDTVAVDRSDRVSKGQVLATLVANVEQAMVAVATKRADMDEEIKARTIERDLAASKRDRLVELHRKKSVPGFEKDEAVAEAALAELNLELAQNNQKLAALDLDKARADLQLRSLVSPIEGVVVDRYVHPGESVKDRPLLKLAQIDPMRVEIIASSELFGVIRKGMEANIIVEGEDAANHRAEVTVVDSVIDAASGTFGIRLSIPNPDNRVVGGLKCSAVFALADG